MSVGPIARSPTASFYTTDNPDILAVIADLRLVAGARELKRSFLTLPSPERQTGFYVMSASSLNTHNLHMDCLPRYESMHSIIYLVGLVVVVLFILSALGLR